MRIKVEATDMDIKEEEMSVITVEEETFLEKKEEQISVLKAEKLLVYRNEQDFCGDVNSPTIKAEKIRLVTSVFVHY